MKLLSVDPANYAGEEEYGSRRDVGDQECRVHHQPDQSSAVGPRDQVTELLYEEDGLLSRGTWGVVTSYRQQTDTETSFTDVTQGRTVSSCTVGADTSWGCSWRSTGRSCVCSVPETVMTFVLFVFVP